jgi:hypothetical protein
MAALRAAWRAPGADSKRNDFRVFPHRRENHARAILLQRKSKIGAARLRAPSNPTPIRGIFPPAPDSERFRGDSAMKAIDTIKCWVGALTELGLMLLALAIVLALLVGSNLPFFGSVTSNIMALVKDMGANGLVGLITLGVILWLFSNRKMA